MRDNDTPVSSFADLHLAAPVLRVLQEVGYESPSPIQAATIPELLSNRDVLGQAQTGTGKTAAFALPVLTRLDIRQSTPQALVLAPTRELAIQVAEAFQRYATHIPGFQVLPIYGGQSYGPQLSALRRGVHVVVGTPGRVIDHLEKNTLDLSKLKTLVLDEADEMLRMGFIDDVETILQKTPASRQTALFSATMPPAIKRIAQTYLRNPAEVTIASKTSTADNIRQRYWLVSGMHKLDALTRILEAEPFDGMIIFARTKLATEELATKLQARGFSATAINGDMAQQQRERTIAQLKDGKIDILVATDVAARGLDVERISHVVNYDVPHDPESYTHRIGRTGRAGRSGEAILFITPRERGLLKAIERATRQPVSPLELPTIQAVNDVRIARFKDQITETLDAGGLEIFQSLIEDYERERNVPAVEIAAALAKLARGDVPLLLDKTQHEPQGERSWADDKPGRANRVERSAQPRKEHIHRVPDPGMQTYRIEVGYVHGVKPGNIVGAIANEGGIDSKHIGRIEIYDDYSTLDLPDDLPQAVLSQLQKVWVAGQQLRISRDGTTVPVDEKAFDKASEKSREKVSEKINEKNSEKASEKPLEKKPRAAKKAVDPDAAPPAEKDRPRESMLEVAATPTAKGSKANTGKTKFAMEAYRIEIGHAHGVKPANIVGAIANEAGLDAQFIGRIDIFDDYSLLDLPKGMPNEVFAQLKTASIGGQQLRISRAGAALGQLKAADGKKATFAPPKKGGDRRVQEKNLRDKAPAKGKAGTATPKAKPHRKGAKSA